MKLLELSAHHEPREAQEMATVFQEQRGRAHVERFQVSGASESPEQVSSRCSFMVERLTYPRAGLFSAGISTGAGLILGCATPTV